MTEPTSISKELFGGWSSSHARILPSSRRASAEIEHMTSETKKTGWHRCKRIVVPRPSRNRSGSLGLVLRAVVAVALCACSGAPEAGVDARPPQGEHLPGTVTVSQYLQPERTSIYGSFEDGRDQCGTSLVSGCTVTHCFAPDSYAQGFDAGVLTVSGSTTHMLNPTTASYYRGLLYSYGAMAHQFVEDETLTVSTIGATVPKFETTISMPARATAVRPSSLVISRTEPFAINWTGGSGDVVVYFSYGIEGINCHFAADAGAGTVPADVTAMLIEGGRGYLTVATQNDVTVSAAPWDVQVRTFQHAVWSDGSVANVPVEFK